MIRFRLFFPYHRHRFILSAVHVIISFSIPSLLCLVTFWPEVESYFDDRIFNNFFKFDF
jgi:hypothetical protein